MGDPHPIQYKVSSAHAPKWFLDRFNVDSVDIGASAKLELVDKFCYLGDMLSMDGDADAAVEARIRICWNKFTQLVPLRKDVSLIMRKRLCSSCVRSSMLHGSETGL